MALSNMFREPRREITESLIGLAVFALPLYLDYRVSAAAIEASPKGAPPLIVAMFLFGAVFFIAGLALWGMAVFTHFIGEVVCGAMARRGLEVRPKERYR